MKRRIFGRRRSIFIWLAPALALFSFEPRSFFNRVMAALAGALMSNWPMRVSLVTSAAESAHNMASQVVRRALRAGNSGVK